MESKAECTRVDTMTDLIESAGARTTTMMAGFTIMIEARTVLVITLRKRSEDITTSATAKTTNSIIAIILTNGTNIRGIPSNAQDMKIGGNEA
jgi:hypothetical protein